MIFIYPCVQYENGMIAVQYMSISTPMTVIAIANGMLGGSILVLPLLALRTGYLLIAPITILSGIISLYSCLLCLRHLRDFKDLDDSVLYHFNNQRMYKIIYDVIVGFSLTVLLIVYFDLITNQWTGIFSYSLAIPLCNYVALFVLTYFLKKVNFGTNVLAYGIVSIVAYSLFLVWTTATASPGINVYPPTSSLYVQFAAALGQGFAVQTFFIPVLKQNLNVSSHKSILIGTYAIGICIYLFISYSGSYSILNRVPNANAQTIEDYFKHKEWEVTLIQIVYLIHLYSTFPQFLIVLKHRVLSIFECKKVVLGEILVLVSILTMCLGVQLSGLKITTLIEINGAVVSFLIIYFIPISLHIKCVYFTHPHSQLKEQKDAPLELKDFSKGADRKGQSNLCQDQIEKKNGDIDIQSKKEQQNDSDKVVGEKKEVVKAVQCDCKYTSKMYEIVEIVWIVVMLCVGIYIMIDSIIKL